MRVSSINQNKTIYETAATQPWKGKSLQKSEKLLEIAELEDEYIVDKSDIDISLDKENRYQDN